MKKSNNIISDFLDKMSPEDKKRIDERIQAEIAWLEAHPDFNERYGTDRSYWLEKIRQAGIEPVGITIMVCEETIIVNTQEEIQKGWELFKAEGWWYTVDEFKQAWKEYVDELYDGDMDKAPTVYWLNENK